MMRVCMADLRHSQDEDTQLQGKQNKAHKSKQAKQTKQSTQKQ
jgi:hypothetical protein